MAQTRAAIKEKKCLENFAWRLYFDWRKLLIWMLLSFWIKTFFFSDRVDWTSDCRFRIEWAEEFYWEGKLSVDSISVCNLSWFVMLMKPYTVSRKCLLTEGAATFPRDTHHKSWLVAPFICLHQTAASNPGAHRIQCVLRDTSPWWHGAP